MAALEKIFQLLDVEPDAERRPRRARARADPRRGTLRRRLLRLRAAPPRARRRRRRPAAPVLALEHVDLDDPARPDGRAGGRHRGRQVDDGEAGRALLRPDARARAGRRPRPARGLEPLAALADGDRAAGGVPVLRHGRREHRLRPPRRRRAEQIRAAAAAVGAEEFISELPARLRHRGRRARRAALGRTAPADRVRARADRRPAHPGPRRGDLERRPAHRGAASRRACAACSPGAPRS